VAALIELDDVAAALDLGDRSHVALVGGGGKSTVLLTLGRTLPGRIVLTTTVKMGADQHGAHPVLLDPTDEEVVAAAMREPVVVWSRIDGQKAIGIDPARCDRLAVHVDHLLVEADGARRQPFKAPASYEPVVPPTANVVACVMGIEAIGKVIADRCHRPMRVAALAEVSPYERLTVAGAARVLAHERGHRASVPPAARYVVVATKIGSGEIGIFTELADRLDLEGIETIGIRRIDDSASSARR
jgi:probable selenium-dependent hydroxylase accessory protein YqeC